MRVLLTSWAWPTHFYPMVPLAWALRAAGHDVRVAVPPSLAGVVAASGLPVVEAGTERIDAVARIREYIPGRPAPAPGAKPGRGPRAVTLFAELAQEMAEDVVAFADAWRPDLVVHEPTAYAGPLAASVLGVPAVRLPWGADLMDREATRVYEREVLAPLFARFGVDGVDLAGALTLDVCPSAMQVPDTVRPPGPRRQPMRYVPYNGSGRVPSPLPPASRRRPRVCVTWGTTVGRLDGRMLLAGDVVAALEPMDVGILVAVSRSQRHLLGRLPERVKVLESVPLDVVLPHCDLVVGHGGAGSILTGLVHGLPQLVVPQLIDHGFNAQRFAATGAGLSLSREEATAEGVREAVGRLVEEPGYRKAAQEVRQEIAGRPSPAAVVPVLAALAEGGGR